MEIGPQLAGVAITALVARLLLLSGALHLMFAWRSGTPGRVRRLVA